MLTGAYTIFHVANINPHYAYYYYLSLDNVKAMRPLYKIGRASCRERV